MKELGKLGPLSGINQKRQSPWQAKDIQTVAGESLVRSSYSLRNILLGSRSRENGFEYEISSEIQRTLSSSNTAGIQNESGVHIPFEIFTRDVSVGSGGSALVQTTVEKDLAAALVPVSTAIEAGATIISGLTGSFQMARVATSGFPQFLSENGIPNAVGSGVASTFSVIGLSPCRLTSTFLISGQLLKQESVSTEDLIKNVILRQLGSMLDYSIYNGIGASAPLGPQPLGLLNMSVNSPGGSDLNKLAFSGVTFNGSPTWAATLDLLKAVETQNVVDQDLTWITSPVSKNILQQTEVVANYPTFIWTPENTIAGKPALASNNIYTNQLVLGCFKHLLVCCWTLLIDPNVYTYAAAGMIQYNLTLLFNTAPLYGVAFSTSTDAV